MSSAWGLSWGNSWGNSWGLLTVPYFSLSGKQRVYVRTVLESVYAKTEVEQIVSTAAINRISVLDSITSLRIDPEPAIKAAKEVRKSAPKSVEIENATIYATTEMQSVSVMTINEPVYVTPVKNVSTEAQRRKPRTIETSGTNLTVGD